MTKYSNVEIQTAENLLKRGYKWIVRDTTFYGNAIYAYKEKPHKEACRWMGTVGCRMVCNDEVPIFQNVGTEDTEPTSIESIVHPQILDDAEKRYLKRVIKPFKNRIKCISKISVMHLIGDPGHYISIRFTDGSDDMNFPVFYLDKMYKGMDPDRWYTLEELGL